MCKSLCNSMNGVSHVWLIERAFTHMLQTRDFFSNPILTPVMARLRWVEPDYHFHLHEQPPLNLTTCINHPLSTFHAHHHSNQTFLALPSILAKLFNRLHPRIDFRARHSVCLSNIQHL